MVFLIFPSFDDVKAENLDVLLRQETYLMLYFKSQVYLCKQEFNNKLLSLMSNILFFWSEEAKGRRMAISILDVYIQIRVQDKPRETNEAFWGDT